MNRFSFFFRCTACQSYLHFSRDLSSFPLCTLCQESLVSCPPLCSGCASPYCMELPTKVCQRPWIQRPAIQSYSALYWLNNPGYRVLRKWKSRRGLLFDHQILKPNALLFRIWQDFQADFIIPIPQRYQRQWAMRGSRTERLAQWMNQRLQLPILPILQRKQGISSKRQAELSLNERLQNEILFSVSPYALKTLQERRVILVDDFFTTGRTLEQAAVALQFYRIQAIHAFTLGIRTTWIYS